MAVLVGEDVGLRERAALGAEAVAQVVEEAEVEVDLLVAPGSRTDRPATLAQPQPVGVSSVKKVVVAELVAAADGELAVQ